MDQLITAMTVSLNEWGALVRGEMLMLTARDCCPQPCPAVTWVFVPGQPDAVLPVRVIGRTLTTVMIRAVGAPQPWERVNANPNESERKGCS